jgi:hypothetical protein
MGKKTKAEKEETRVRKVGKANAEIRDGLNKAAKEDEKGK